MKYFSWFLFFLSMVSSLYCVESSDSTQSSKPFTSIDSNLLDFNVDKRIASFEGNVIAVDPQLKLTCTKMLVYFDQKSNEVIKIDAIGDVHMYHEGKEAIGEKARFTRETGVIILTGPKPKLKDEKGNWVISRGEGIIYDLRAKQMHVDKPTMELLPSNGLEPIK